MNYQYSIKTKIVAGISACAILLAGFGISFQNHTLVPQALAATGISTSDITIGNTSQTAWITLDSAGPYNVDFRYTVCWNSSQQTGCGTSAWATDAATQGGSWSPWFWPGYQDGLQPNVLYVQSVQTRPLPAGEYLDDVHLGLELSEDNGGTLIGSSAPLSCAGYVGGYTSDAPEVPGSTWDAVHGQSLSPSTDAGDPAQNPYTPQAHTYGCQGTSNSPDDMQTFIYAELLSGSASSSTIPSTMTTGQTITNGTVTINNTSTSSYSIYSNSNPGVCVWNCDDAPGQPSRGLWFYGNGESEVTSGGAIDPGCSSSDGDIVDTNGHPVADLPYENDTTGQGNYYSCTVNNVTVGAGGLTLQHTGSFTTPATVNSPSVSNVSITNWYQASYTASCYDPSNPYGPYIDCSQPATSGENYNYPNGAQSPPFAVIPGQSITFNIPSFTAPSTPGTYTETWKFNDIDGDVPGTTYSKTITVSNNNQGINVTADRTANWEIKGAVSQADFNGSGTSGSYPSAVPDTYNLKDPNTGQPPYAFTDNPTTSLRNTRSLFARIVKSAEASNCAGWICTLTNGGTVNYNLQSTTCSITVQTSVNGGAAPIGSGLSYTVSGPVDTSSTYSSTPQTFNLVADANGSQFSLNNMPQTISYNGYTSDLASITPGNPSSCSAGGSMTMSANYTTRGNLNIQ